MLLKLYKITTREYVFKKGKLIEEYGNIQNFDVLALGLEDAMAVVKPSLGKHEDIDEVELIREDILVSDLVKRQIKEMNS